MNRTPRFFLALTLASFLMSNGAPADGATRAPARIGPAHYDADTGVLRVPYSGTLETPRAYFNSRTWFHYDFPAARTARGGVQQGGGRGPLTRFFLANRQGQVARLSLRLSRPGKPVLQVDQAAHEIRVSFNLASPAPAAKAAPRPATPRPAPTPRVAQRPAPARAATPRPTAKAAAPARRAVATPRPATPRPTASPRPAATPAPRLTPAPALKPAPRRKPAASPTPPPRPVEITTRYSGTFFDSERHSLLLPYVGEAPRYHLLPVDPLTVHVDFSSAGFAASSEVRRFGQALEGNVLLRRWEARELPEAGVVRLTLNLTRPAEVLVAHDAERREIRVFPQLIGPEELGRSTRSEIVRSLLSYATYDAAAGGVVIPYFGQRPVYVIEQIDRSYVNVSFLDTAVDPAGVQFDLVDQTPVLSFWLLAKRPQEHVARLTLSLPYGGYVTVHDDSARKRLIVTPQLGEPPQAP